MNESYCDLIVERTQQQSLFATEEMRSLWLDRGTGPNPAKIKQYSITGVYEDIRDATKASVAANAALCDKLFPWTRSIRRVRVLELAGGGEPSRGGCILGSGERVAEEVRPGAAELYR